MNLHIVQILWLGFEKYCGRTYSHIAEHPCIVEIDALRFAFFCYISNEFSLATVTLDTSSPLLRFLASPNDSLMMDDSFHFFLLGSPDKRGTSVLLKCHNMSFSTQISTHLLTNKSFGETAQKYFPWQFQFEIYNKLGFYAGVSQEKFWMLKNGRKKGQLLTQ